MHGHAQLKRNTLEAKLHKVMQQLAVAERKKEALVSEIDAYRTTIDRLRADKARSSLALPTGEGRRVPPKISLVRRRDDGPAFEDTQIM